MRYLITILLFTICITGFSQKSLLIPDTTTAIPTLHFDSNGDLIIKASQTSSVKDFDYLVGNWKLKNRKLKSRLTNNTEWIEFESKVEMHQILGGNGNIEIQVYQYGARHFHPIMAKLGNGIR